MAKDDMSSEMVYIREEEEGVNVLDDKVYVAVSKELKACKSTLVWALQNTGGKKLCIVHVHQPSQTMSILGGRFPLSAVSEPEVMAHKEKERQHMNNILDDYVSLCTEAGVQGEKLYIEMRTVESGLLNLITENKIERLVMGAAADNRYSREGTKVPIHKPRITQSSSGWSANLSRVCSEESFDDVDQSSTFSLSHLSIFSRSSETATESTSLPLSRTEDREPSLRSLSLPPTREEKRHYSRSVSLLKMNMKESLHDQLEQAIADAKIAKQETFQESYKRHQAEKEASDAIAKAIAAESSLQEELRRRKKFEEELVKAKEELESTKKQRDMALEQLQNRNSSLKSQCDKSNAMEEELEDKLRSTLELFQKFRQV